MNCKIDWNTFNLNWEAGLFELDVLDVSWDGNLFSDLWPTSTVDVTEADDVSPGKNTCNNVQSWVNRLTGKSNSN